MLYNLENLVFTHCRNGSFDDLVEVVSGLSKLVHLDISHNSYSNLNVNDFFPKIYKMIDALPHLNYLDIGDLLTYLNTLIEGNFLTKDPFLWAHSRRFEYLGLSYYLTEYENVNAKMFGSFRNVEETVATLKYLLAKKGNFLSCITRLQQLVHVPGNRVILKNKLPVILEYLLKGIDVDCGGEGILIKAIELFVNIADLHNCINRWFNK